MTPNRLLTISYFVMKVLVVAAMYYLTARLGFAMAIPPGNVTAFWPPSGIALASALMVGWPGLLGVFLGSLAVNAGSMSGPMALPVAAGIAAASTLQAWLSVDLLRLWVKKIPPDTVRLILQALGVVTITTLIAPIMGPAVLCLAGTAQWSNLATLFWTWWIGDYTGVLMFAPLLIVLYQKAQRKPTREFQAWTLTSFIVGMSLFTFSVLYIEENNRFNSELKIAADDMTHLIEDEANSGLHDVLAIRSFYNASQQVERPEFSGFTLDLMKDSSMLLTLAWAERVADADRPAYEQRVRAEGFTDFQIFEQDAAGQNIPAAQRPEYYPYTFIEPFTINKNMLGFDIGSVPFRQETLTRAMATGEPVATPPLQLITPDGFQNGIQIIIPIFKKGSLNTTFEARRANLIGLATVNMPINAWLHNAMAGIKTSNIAFYLYDLDSAGEAHFLAYYSAASGAQSLPAGEEPPQLSRLQSGNHYSENWEFAGRKWVLVFQPLAGFRSPYAQLEKWLPLLLGVILAGGFLIFVNRRQQAEAILTRSERNFRSLSDYAVTGIIRFKQSGIILYANQAVALMFGYEHIPEFMNRSIYEHANQPEQFEEPVKTLLPGSQLVNHELGITTLKGEKRNLLFSAGIFEDVISVNIMDITDRKAAEEALRESEARLRMLIEEAPMAIHFSRNECLTYVNPEFLRIFGYDSTDEILGKPVVQLYVPETQMALEARMARQENGNLTSDEMERTGIRKDGSQFPVQVNISLVQLHDGSITISFIMDITQRKKNETDLAAYREHLEDLVQQRAAEVQDLYDNAPTGYHSLDIHGTYVMVNQTELDWLGYTREEMIGKMNLTDVLTPESTAYFHTIYPAFIRQGWMKDLEYDFVRKDGSIIPIISNAVAVYDENGQYKYSRTTLFDNTERKKTQEAIRQSEATYRALFENSNDGIFLLSPEGRELNANSKALAMLGYTQEEYERLNRSENNIMTIMDEQDEVHERFRAVLRGEQVPLYERSFISKSGKKITAEINLSAVRDVNGNVILVQGVVRDITERKAIEEHIRRINFLSDTALELTKAGYWHVPLDGSGYYISSERTATINGDPPRSDYRYSLVDDWLKCVLQADETAGKQAYSSFEDAVAGRIPRYDATYAYRRPFDGRVIWVHAVGNVVSDDEGRVREIYGVTQDITEQKMLELELLKARDAAEAANRAKSTFLANMSHEIRTPMNAILGFTRLVLGDENLPEKHRDHLEIINHSGEHLLSLINEILEMSKIEAGRVVLHEVAFDLHALMADVESMFRLRVEAKNLKFKIEMAKNLPRFVIADEIKLKEILINLLGNAVKFTQQGGITLRISSEKHLIGSRSKALRLIVEVEDSGMGIAPEDMGRLFQSFGQTNSGAQVKGGTGLGLAISQTHARLMGGDIVVTSQVGMGSCFRVEILMEEADGAEEQTDAPRRQAAGLKPGMGPFCMLVVDDNEENRRLLVEILTQNGFETREAMNGEEALKVFAEWQPHMVLMDLRMPVLDGFEATKRIKAMPDGAKIPVVALTASVVDLDRERFNECGLNGYVRKPFKDYELFAVIEEHLGAILLYREDSSRMMAETENLEMVGPDALTPESLKQLPSGLMDKMRIATMGAQLDDLLELIGQVENPRLAGQLRNLANQFEYDALMRLFEKS